MKGTIKKLSDKAFGFIIPENGSKDIFFHANDLADVTFESLREGMTVSYEVEQAPKGPKAVNIVVEA